MKTISKKFLQKIANKLGIQILIGPDKDLIFMEKNMKYLGFMFITCPELAEGEIIKPEEKWDYPIATFIPKEGFVWCNVHIPNDEKWSKNNHLSFPDTLIYVHPDPNNPDKPPKKNWRPHAE